MRLGMDSPQVAIALVCLSLTVHSSVACGSTMKLDINTCVDMALEVNVSMLEAGYELDRAKSAVLGSASSILPTVGLTSKRSRLPDEVEINGAIVPNPHRKTYSASLYFGESVTLGGIMGVVESMASKRASDENLRQVRQNVTFDAKQKYLEVLKTGRLVAVAEEAFALSQRRLDRAQALVEVGSAVRSDVLRAQVEVSRNELELISARNAHRLAQTDLRHFLAVGDDVELELEDILETAEVDYTLEDALSEAMVMRPDIKIGRETLGAANAAIWKERGGWFPYIQLGGAYEWSDTEVPDGIGDVWDEAEWSWSISSGISLFDGFATFSGVRSAKASRRSAEENLLQLRRDASLEVKRAFYNLEEARQRVKVSGETVGLAEEELRLAEERYRLGGVTMLEQIDSQVALSEARTSYVEALYDYLLSQAQLVRAMGKD